MDYELWQRRWDLQQEGYMPDREPRLTALLDVVEARGTRAPSVLDLGGGTGSITRRLLSRLPEARSVLVDIDPALLALARGSFAGDERVRVVAVDLSSPAWTAALEGGRFDAVVTATALHWLEPDRLRSLYGEVRGLLREGGLVANVDHLHDEGLAPLEEGFARILSVRGETYRSEHGALDWQGWWAALADEPEMRPLVEARDEIFGPGGSQSHARAVLSSRWHLDALRDAGFASVGIAWRNLGDALVVGLV